MQDRGYLQRLARSIAAARGIDPDLFVRLINQESGFNPTVLSEKGALGLAQVMPDTAKKPGFGVKPILDRLDPVESLRFGADYFAAMLKRYDGDVAKALAAYNFGPGNVDKGRKYPEETRNYIAAIMQTGDSDEERVERYEGLMEFMKEKREEENRRARQSAALNQALSALAPPEVEQAQVDYRSTMGKRGSGSTALDRLGVASLYDFE